MKKKGFTLVELLAVIVILAIIALIATPIILNVIETARKEAAKSSALGYMDAVEKQIVIDQLDTTNNFEWNGEHTEETLADKVKVKGQVPEDVYIKISNGKITEYSITVDGYKVSPDAKGNIIVEKVGEESKEDNNPPEEETPGEENTEPVNVGLANCRVVDQEDSTKYTLGDEYSCDPGDGVKRTFYVLDNSDQASGYIELLMHGNIGQSQWASPDAYAAAKADSTCNDYVNYGDSCNDAGPLTARAFLKQETTDKGWTVPVDLPTVEQIAYAAGYTEWENYGTDESLDITSNWLVSGLNNNGGYNYWTASVPYNSVFYIWTVEEQDIANYKASISAGSEAEQSAGVVPVIKVVTTN